MQGDAQDDWVECRETACRSCGAVFDLGRKNGARHVWRLWNLRYGPCPACGSRAWCKPFDGVPVPRGFAFGGVGAVSLGAVALVFSGWGSVLVAAGIAALAYGAILSGRRRNAARKRGRNAGRVNKERK